ncbi:MAG TPA: deoxyribonuclease IV [Nitrososphaera sp.]|nr:deoxyribonuclease IV [Nitrososphaera sp.]
MGVRVGFHVSIAGGISNSVNNAKKLGCTAFQIFTRNPRGWASNPIPRSEVFSFKNRLVASGIERTSVVVHMPYLPNLSGPPGELYQRSVKTLNEEIQRCELLGIPYLVIHLGSHMGRGSNSGIDQLINALSSADAQSSSGNGVVVLLENNAGYKNNVGGTLEELRLILDRLNRSDRFGLCIDTCHLFASGYDLRTKESASIVIEKIENIVGMQALKVIHLNDSKGPLGSNLDRHEHIGLGSIGMEGIAAFISHPTIKTLPIIMETPIDKRRGDEGNLEIVLEALNNSR